MKISGMENLLKDICIFQISSWPRGKVLGGSSVLNFMVHMWGTRADFDENWAHIGTEYSFKNVQEYYQRVENYQGSYVSG